VVWPQNLGHIRCGGSASWRIGRLKSCGVGGALLVERPRPRTPLCFSVFKGLESWYIDGQAIKRGNRSEPPATPKRHELCTLLKELSAHVYV
jgi:hypothetical protein